MASHSSLLAQLKSLQEHLPTDTAERKELYNTMRQLTLDLEDSQDTISRVIYSPQQLYVTVIADDLKIFTTLANSNSPLAISDFEKTTTADSLLLARILRYLGANGLIKEVGEGKYAANNITKTMAVPGFAAGARQAAIVPAPCAAALPQYLKNINYANPTEANKSAFQLAHNTDLPAWVWAMQRPELFADFNLWMSVQHSADQTWLNVLDFESLIKGATPETVVFVDVGGGVGTQCAALKQRYPDLTGKVVLQDLYAVDMAIPTPGVTVQKFDFWNEQPIKGARAYYMRNVLHDYPDKMALELLKKTIEAMGEDSVILIDELVVPNEGAHWRATQLDINMMSTISAIERTERQWETLLDAAGLKIKEKHAYSTELQESIIVAVRK